jgi:hypothetical protein
MCHRVMASAGVCMLPIRPGRRWVSNSTSVLNPQRSDVIMVSHKGRPKRHPCGVITLSAFRRVVSVLDVTLPDDRDFPDALVRTVCTRSKSDRGWTVDDEHCDRTSDHCEPRER